jgi:hypothetical protein
MNSLLGGRHYKKAFSQKMEVIFLALKNNGSKSMICGDVSDNMEYTKELLETLKIPYSEKGRVLIFKNQSHIEFRSLMFEQEAVITFKSK